MAMRNILTVAYFVLAIYMFGGGVMSTLVYYKSWKLVSVEDFAAVHRLSPAGSSHILCPLLFCSRWLTSY